MMAKIFILMGFPLFLAEASAPLNAILSIDHSVFIKGDQTNFEIEPSFGVEASEIYPDVKYTTVDELLNQLVWEVDFGPGSFHCHAALSKQANMCSCLNTCCVENSGLFPCLCHWAYSVIRQCAFLILCK